MVRATSKCVAFPPGKLLGVLIGNLMTLKLQVWKIFSTMSTVKRLNTGESVLIQKFYEPTTRSEISLTNSISYFHIILLLGRRNALYAFKDFNAIRKNN